MWQKQAMPAPESVCLLKLYPNLEEIGYFGAKTLKFIHLPALAKIPGYVTVSGYVYDKNTSRSMLQRTIFVKRVL